MKCKVVLERNAGEAWPRVGATLVLNVEGAALNPDGSGQGYLVVKVITSHCQDQKPTL